MKKVILKITLIIAILAIVIGFSNTVFATAEESIITKMEGVKNVTGTDGQVGHVINVVIKLIQYAGSGISVITVTMLGVKYIMASANEKADLKKQGIPVVTGCVLLFAAVNLVGIIADFGESLNG